MINSKTLTSSHKSLLRFGATIRIEVLDTRISVTLVYLRSQLRGVGGNAVARAHWPSAWPVVLEPCNKKNPLVSSNITSLLELIRDAPFSPSPLDVSSKHILEDTATKNLSTPEWAYPGEGSFWRRLTLEAKAGRRRTKQSR